MARMCWNRKFMVYGIVTIICFISESDAQCSSTQTDVKRFGTDCEYLCHCMNKEQCDATTGECTSGCDFEWVGPGCQFKNIAFGEESRHSDNIFPPMYSDLANDRDLSTCSFTGTSDAQRSIAPWWTLWLPYYATFRKLVFVTKRSHLPYFPNFKLTVQNVTKPDFLNKVYSTNGVLCYQQDSSIPQETTVQVTCTGVPIGNLIRLQLANTSTQLVICDFRVYAECDNGYYGKDCKTECSSTCSRFGSRACDNVNGNCLNGCNVGWKGSQCENKCNNGYYGKDCKMSCSDTCSSSGLITCDYVNGNCLNGCKPGWKGFQCEQKCEEGKWGNGCGNTCGKCFSTICNHVNGKCPNGCAAGIQPSDLCNDECNNGYYGKDCKMSCSDTCSSSGLITCDNVNGNCLNGCKPGWKCFQCEQKCEEGKWGNGCGNTCGKCFSTICNHVNGKCPNGCAAGIQPSDLCNDECNNGYYGKDCKMSCSDTCSSSGLITCDNVNGNCLNGCKPGWKGFQCEQKCEEGKWGNGCGNTCGKCFSTICNHVNGKCPNGCAAGIQPSDLCNDECNNGYYGKDCKMSCSDTCSSSGLITCDNVNGNCLNGCKPGWKGFQCEQKCEEGKWGSGCGNTCGKCFYTICNHVNGKCPNGCAAGIQPSDLCNDECNNGYYGKDCKMSCSDTCSSSGLIICDNVNGNCLNGCKPGWKGFQCEQKCEEGKWGNGCGNTCGKCFSTICNHVNGKCPNGCAAGIQPSDLCNDECNNGYYGKDCKMSCSDTCSSSGLITCDNVNGNCLNGCKPGWKGFQCEQKCEEGKWGNGCGNTCGKCFSTICNHVNGKCPNGCAAGIQPSDLCNDECNNGYYGKDCKMSCSDTCSSSGLITCDNVNGNCLNGCKTGWKGFQCEQKCEEGKWGSGCGNTCGKCFSTICNHVNGKCPNGCAAGIQPSDLCNDECNNGYYGKDCKMSCSDTCSSSGLITCDNVNGNCLNGCKPGWKGFQCEQKCEEGKWGNNCAKTCGNCFSAMCDIENGECPNGCAEGFKLTKLCNQECENGTYGKHCAKNCSANCNNVCDKVNGTCSPCKAGWKGADCTTECEPGYWGLNCAEVCGKCIDKTTCNTSNGICSGGGCMRGFKFTERCDKECDVGTYGVACKQNCSKNCANICSRFDGKCGRCQTGWSGELCAEQAEDPKEKSSPVAAIAASVSGAVAAIIAVGLVIFFKMRRKQLSQKPFTSNSDEFSHNLNAGNAEHKQMMPGSSNIYVNSSNFLSETPPNDSQELTESRRSENKGHESNYYNTQSGHEVRVSELESYVKKGLANKDYFIRQFQQIPYGMQYPSDIATKPGNHGKNRYKSMYAYDHSRVTLKTLPDQPGTDYINATYITGYSGENAYIAAQGPIANTLGDFWRMIWEQNIKTIVMATNLSEEGKMKCVQYWAEVGERVKHGNTTLATESEDVFAEFTVRRLKVSQEGTTGKQRTVTQFHYTAWPDKDVPRSTSSLLHFWYQVRRHDGKKTRPWLVHCSAGVGCTGTFIALDIQYEQGTDKGSVDVFKCVDELRKQRVNMVQTKDQYKYLHRIIVEALVLPSQPIPTHKFHSFYNDLKEINPKTRKTILLLQYETLIFESDTTSGNDSEDDIYISAKRAENKQKNRYDNILAPNEFRPFLLTQVPGCTDYINGVFIPGYRDKFGYILIQTPMKSTAIDCCRLVYEQEVKIIVSFQENGDDDIGTYLPEKGPVKLGPFTMAFVAEEDKTNFARREYQLTFKSEKRSVTQLNFKQWPTSSLTPSNSEEMLYFLEELENLQRQNENKPILVQCLNGAERSGLVVILMNIFERLRFDKEVSIPLVIRQLKIRRQQIIPNFEQFKFCHDVVLSYIEGNSIYANM